MKFTEAGKKMMDDANKLNNERICPNCTHFNVCKIYRMVAVPLQAEYPDGNSPLDPNRIAEVCDEFRHKDLATDKLGDQLFTV